MRTLYPHDLYNIQGSISVQEFLEIFGQSPFEYVSWKRKDLQSLLKNKSIRKYFPALLGDFIPREDFFPKIWKKEDLSSLHLFQNNMLSNASLSDCDLSDIDFQLCLLFSTEFRNSVISGHFHLVEMMNVDVLLSQVFLLNMFHCVWTNCEVIRTDFRQCSFRNSVWDSVEMKESFIFQSQFYLHDFKDSIFTGVEFLGCSFDSVDFLSGDFSDATFDSCTFTNCELPSNVELIECVFKNSEHKES